MALGEIDYGLLGLVGGMAAFVAFFSELMSGAVSRFYAISLGFSQKNPQDGLDECRGWFCTACFIYSTLPVVLLLTGYWGGVWAIYRFLVIPLERLEACVWVWRFTCASCFIGMLAVPFRAMYVAKQYIAELTIYSFFSTLLNFGVAYYMVSHTGVWLTRYALWMCLLSIIPNLIISARAISVFPECKVSMGRLIDVGRLKELGKYVSYRFIGAVSSLCQSQGNSILVNKFLGARFNATMAVGNTMASHVVSLSTAMSGAIGPAIYNAYGSGDRARMLKLVACASKVGALLYLIFMLPVMLEIDELFVLWLKNPPPCAPFIGMCVLMAYLTERLTDGEVNAIYATGNIKRFQVVLSACCLFGLVICGILLKAGMGMIGVGIAIILFKSMIMVGRIVFSRIEAGVSARHWILRVFIPLLVVSAIGLIAGSLARFFMVACVLRIIVTTVLVEMVFLPSVWLIVLDKGERAYLWSRVNSFFSFLKTSK